MGWLRSVGRLAGAGLWALALAPVLTLPAAAVLDRSPDGAPRASLFPAALAALDPYTWDCARNSLLVAAAVTLAARFVGVGLARLACRRRFLGRPLLSALACSGLVVPPAFGAVGLRALFGDGPEPWPGVGWWAWFWVGLVAGAPAVALATASGLGRVDPSWEDAARLEGATGGRVWRQLVWPVVRPGVARALGLVFALTLLEPGAPLVLNLRRTLAFQIVEAATDPGPGRLTRAAVLALVGTVLAAVGRVLIGWWGGAAGALPDPDASDSPVASTPPRPGSPASWWQAPLFAGTLGLAVFAVGLPVAGLARSVSLSPRAVRALADDPLTRGYVVNAAILGAAVVALDLLLARTLAAWALVRRSGRGRWLDRLAGYPEAVPPLALGVGVLAAPAVLRMAAGGAGETGLWPSVVGPLADVLDADRVPWVALVVAVGLARLPMLSRSALDRTRSVRPEGLDAAVTLGASPRRARRTLAGGRLGASPSAVFLTFALAATNVAPALLFAPTADTRPLGPAVLSLADEPDSGFPRASALALLGLALNLAALAPALRGRGRGRVDGSV